MRKPKICPMCGESFIPKESRSTYCGKLHTRICKTCGKEFEYKCEANSDPDKCYNCRSKLFKKICKYCGKEFVTASYQKQICNREHYRICEICGKEFIVPNHRLDDTTLTCCSKECSSIKRSRNIKLGQSQLTGNWWTPKTIYTKTCKYCGKQFKTHSPTKEYCNDDHIAICEICGKSYHITLDQIQQHHFICSKECRSKKQVRAFIGDESISKKWEEFLEDPEIWIHQNFEELPTYIQLSSKLQIATSTIQQQLAKRGLDNLIRKHVSSMEQEVYDFIHSLDSNIIIQRNNRNTIKPYEIDIYLPDYKFGIECNPTASHNSTLGLYNSVDNILPKNYHKIKTDLAEENHIFLLHLFGYEWSHKKNILKSIIRNVLHKNDYKIFARNTIIKDIDSNTCKSFLNHNHRQGDARASVRIGLYYEDELVSVMTFCRPRSTIRSNDENGWELLRFCNKLNTIVVGGASKLFNYFIHQYNPETIKSFSDRAHTSGNIYKLLKFNHVHDTSPGYMWVDTSTDIGYNRVNTQKHRLKQFLNDDSIDLSQSESDIMSSHGFVQVFDSGVSVWKWRCNDAEKM